MKHAIIGANIVDRLVKCPGSLKCGSGSLAQYDKIAKRKGKNKYTKNRIECNNATNIGLKIDEMSKNLLRLQFDIREKKMYSKDEDYLDKDLLSKAQSYCNHMLKLRNRLGRALIDPCYDMSKYMKNLPDVQFRVNFNPDFIAMSMDDKLAYISDLTTSQSYDRNKMFQVLCCAVGYIEYHDKCENVICEVYNVVTKEIMISKYSREELEAWRDDIIIPALDRVRNALSSPAVEINDHRNHCSWCNHFCIFKDEGCCKCNDTSNVENEVDIQLNFFCDLMNDADKAAYRSLFE